MKFGTIYIDDDTRDFLVWREGQGRTIEIYDIQVGSDRRKGRGRRMVETLVAEQRALAHNGAVVVYAITRWNNTIAHEFYEALGFRIVARLHNFYRESAGDIEHGIVYGLDL